MNNNDDAFIKAILIYLFLLIKCQKSTNSSINYFLEVMNIVIKLLN